MNFKQLTLIGVITLFAGVHAQANVTPANDDGGGNTIFFDRHVINCGFQGLQSMRLFRPTHSQISFDYQCIESGETSMNSFQTPANDDGGGNTIFLDRHGVDCHNKALQYVHLYRPTHSQIAYDYKCGSTALTDIQDYYTPTNDYGGGNSIFLDRHDVSCPADQVLTYFRLQRPGSNTIRYHYKCGIPHSQIYKEINLYGQCFDGTHAAPGDNIYLGNCHGGHNQKWYLDSAGLIHILANPGLCIDAAGGALHPGANATLQACNVNSPGQRFIAEPNQIKSSYNGEELCLVKELFNSNIQYGACDLLFAGSVTFGSSFSLNNTDPFTYLADMFNSNEVRHLAAAFQIDDLRVQSVDIYGTSIITGRIRSMSNSNPLGLAVEVAVGMRKYLTNDNRNDIPVIITLTNQGNNNYEAKVKLELVRGWREVDVDTVIGTKAILKDADLVLTATVNNGEVTRTIGVEGAVYVKPTSLDNWLYTNPSVVRELSEDPSNDLGLVILGACSAKPHQNTNGSTECTADWNVLNAHVLEAYSQANGGYTYLQVTLVGSTPTGGKVVLDRGRFLSTADISGEWEGNEEGNRGKADVQLNGLDNKVRQVISENDFTGLTQYNYGLLDAYQIREVSVTKDLNGPTKIHVKMTVLGEDVEAIIIPQSTAASYLASAQANEDLLNAVAEAIGRVIVNKTGLAKLVTLVTTGLEVIGLRDGAEVFFNEVGQIVNAAGDVIGGIVEVINPCSWFGC